MSFRLFIFCVVLSSWAAGLSATPDGAPAKLLEEYLSIRTDHPGYGTEEAAKLWVREAKFLGLKYATWTIDPKGRCVNFVTLLPATVETPGRPVMLLHHADVVSAVESEWTSPPFAPFWRKVHNEWEVVGRGAIDDKGPGVAHWMSLRALQDKQRSRDLYFVMNCGEEVGDPAGAEGFVNFLVAAPPKLPGMPDRTYHLTTLEKFEVASLLQKFPSLPRVEWIWNEGSFIETTQLAPYRLAAIATSQKGQWIGRVGVRGQGGHGALSSQATPFEVVTRGTQKLYDENRSFKQKFRALHTEMQQLVDVVKSARPLWQSILLSIYPRLFFELTGLQSMVTSWWVPSKIETNASLPNVIASQVSVQIDYRFLGEKDPGEIERELRSIFSAEAASVGNFEVSVETLSFMPFRRDFFEGSEAKIFKSVLESSPQTLVTPFITPGITDSRFFREVGVRAFDFVPFELSHDEISAMHGRDERLPLRSLERGIERETKILEKILQ